MFITLLRITFCSYFAATPERFSGDSCRCDDSWKSHLPLLVPSSLALSISRNRSLSLGHLHGNSVPTPPAGVCAPRPELKPPHYHGGLWRAAVDRGRLEGTGGRALDEAAAGESVLRILEVMSRAVLYNTRSRPFQSRPLSAFPFLPRPAAAGAPLPPCYEDPDEKWK